ncbi:MAG: tRNA uridine-5-carboxymethylaminomethyl(34) synthesis GTPase MnmE, partial [Bacilli bacterium]|nr:tRNA uridine-5-carboxymethylaminomethyl(34) synthesis GTPase MnmE [Bacilli bacterium]
LTKQASHTIHYGYIVDKTAVLEEVLVSIFKAPKTFTREDVVEINAHGGIYVTNKIVELLLTKGAKLAEPGEFTKRAFLNGRIDLTQAEAVMDVIEAKTKTSLQLASQGLLGETRKLIDGLKAKLLYAIAKIEVNIDYPEYDAEEQITEDVIKPTINELLGDLDNILKNAEIAQIMSKGIKTAIIGKPNVGKSSLLNALLREDKAIVTNIAGTTRDVVEGEVNIGGIVLKLIDTAGIRETKDVVEQIGVQKTKQVLQGADLVILVFDYSEELDDNDLLLLELTKTKKRVIVVNKQDLNKKIDLQGVPDYLLLSSFKQQDIHRLEKRIKEACEVDQVQQIDATYIGNARQLAQLRIAKSALEDALQAAALHQPIDMINIDLTNCYHALQEVLGEVSGEDIINELFSRFCLGK